MLRAGAIDDEPIGLEVILSLSSNVTFLRMEGYFVNPFDAAAFIQPNNINLIMLDIDVLPTVGYLAEQLNVSPDCLSGLLKTLTGQSTQQHIHDKLIEKPNSNYPQPIYP
jgi:hypothetical protein